MKKIAASNRQSGSQGSLLIKDTSAHTLEFTSIIGKEDAVITFLAYANDVETNIIADIGWDDETVVQFETIYCPLNKTFGAIQLASGKVSIQ